MRDCTLIFGNRLNSFLEWLSQLDRIWPCSLPVQLRSRQGRLSFSPRDFVGTGLVETAIWLIAIAITWSLSLVIMPLSWLIFLLLTYIFSVVVTLAILKCLRVFYPIEEGIFTFEGHRKQIYAWSLYGFLCLFNLTGLYGTRCFLPDPLGGLFLRLLGASRKRFGDFWQDQ